MAAFAQFGSDLDKATQEQLANGERMTEILKQPQYKPLPMEEQVVSIYAATPKPPRPSWLRKHALSDVGRFEDEMLGFMRTKGGDVLKAIRETGQLSEETEQKLAALLDEFALHFQPTAKTEAA
jgi:F-type H+-transporting ATPase subunit alpha